MWSGYGDRGNGITRSAEALCNTIRSDFWPGLCGGINSTARIFLMPFFKQLDSTVSNRCSFPNYNLIFWIKKM
jgi:hypothetical protein